MSTKHKKWTPNRSSLLVLPCRGLNFSRMVTAGKVFQLHWQEEYYPLELAAIYLLLSLIAPWNTSTEDQFVLCFSKPNSSVLPSWPLPQRRRVLRSILQTLYPSASFTLSVPNTTAWRWGDIKCKIKQGNEVLSLRLEALWKWLIDFHHMEELPSLLRNAQ